MATQDSSDIAVDVAEHHGVHIPVVINFITLVIFSLITAIAGG